MTSANKKIGVIFHSGMGHTSYQAKAVRDGAKRVAGVDTELIYVEDAREQLDELSSMDAMIFGCPTYMGSVSAPFKQFMDDTGAIWLAQGWRDKIAGGFTNSGNQSGDKLNTLVQLNVFAMQHGMIWAGLGLPGGNNTSTGDVEELNRLGSWMGAMAQSNTDQGIEGIAESDLRTAACLGERIARITLGWQPPRNVE